MKNSLGLLITSLIFLILGGLCVYYGIKFIPAITAYIFGGLLLFAGVIILVMSFISFLKKD